jgi:selenocysteine lyase/cysteine desulfurase
MPNYPAIYAIRAGLAYISEIGVESIYTAAKPLVQNCLDALRQLPVEMLTPADASADTMAGIIAFRHPAMDVIQRHLHNNDIHVMSQAGRMRVAIHGYNNAADIERFLSVLTGALRHVATA